MKSIVLVLLTLIANGAVASDVAALWYCKGSSDTDIQIVVKGARAVYMNAHEVESPVMTVDENKNNVFYHSEGGDCSNQIVGYIERTFVFNGEKSTMSYSWCDDDGEGGEGEYDISCSVIE